MAAMRYENDENWSEVVSLSDKVDIRWQCRDDISRWVPKLDNPMIHVWFELFRPDP